MNAAASTGLAAASKTGVGVGRTGGRAHLIGSLRVTLASGRLQYDARWLCRKQVSSDAILLPSSHGHRICLHCADRLRPCAYRCYAPADRLIYIGSTINRTRRIGQHSLHSDWWPLVTEVRYEEFRTYAEAYGAEQAAIRSERPAFNRLTGGAFVAPDAHLAVVGSAA